MAELDAVMRGRNGVDASHDDGGAVEAVMGPTSEH